MAAAWHASRSRRHLPTPLGQPGTRRAERPSGERREVELRRSRRYSRLRGQQLEEDPQTDHGHRWIRDVEQVGVTGHNPLGLMLVGEGQEIVVVRISAQRGDLGRVVHLSARRQHLSQEAPPLLVTDQPLDLSPSQHVGELAHQPRAQDVLETALDAGGDDPAGYAARGDGRGHEHARVQDDKHYEALRRSARTARNSSYANARPSSSLNVTPRST